MAPLRERPQTLCSERYDSMQFNRSLGPLTVKGDVRAVLAGVVLLGLLSNLGFWQLGRAGEKAAFGRPVAGPRGRARCDPSRVNRPSQRPGGPAGALGR